MELSRPCRWLHKPLVLCALALNVVFLPTEAYAACSDSKVKRLSGQGNTVAAIARTCGVDADEIRDILDEGDDEEKPESPRTPKNSLESGQGSGLAPGTPLAPCGCWGPAAPGHREPNQTCRSGYAMPRMCPQMCPAGGYAWQGVCG